VAFALFVPSSGALVTVASAPPPAIKPGQTIPLKGGVRNTGGAAVDGVVVNIRVSGGLSLPREFANCRYYRDGILGGAWCSLPQRVGAGDGYALSGFRVAASATAQRVSPVVFDWHPASWAEGRGGIAGLAAGGVAGSGGSLALTPAELDGPAVGAVYLRLLTSTDTPRPSRLAGSASVTSVLSRPAGGASPAAGAELPGDETGNSTVLLLAVGLLLLAGGAVAALFVRRGSRYVGKHS
jgi:hypothetical protein